MKAGTAYIRIVVRAELVVQGFHAPVDVLDGGVDLPDDVWRQRLEKGVRRADIFDVESNEMSHTPSGRWDDHTFAIRGYV